MRDPDRDDRRDQEMKAEEWQVLIELKYCERCGELWFRESGSNASLCGPCATQEPRVAERYAKRSNGNKEERWFGPMTETIQALQGVAAVSGRTS
jgi:hypothetical protein